MKRSFFILALVLWSSSSMALTLQATIRDMREDHPDFERDSSVDAGIVRANLGPDGKPVYGDHPQGTKTTTNASRFDEWYHDSPVSKKIVKAILLTENQNGLYEFSDSSFFPIDGEGWGNEGDVYKDATGTPHNFHFTTEIHARFTYKGGEVFTFTGDDDVFVFINGKLAIDLGGIHGALSKTVALNDSRSALGIEQGKTYSLDIFHAERHTQASNFKMTTSLELVDNPNPPQPSTNGCGDGDLDAGEECDDGNGVDLDSCSNDCRVRKGITVFPSPDGTHLPDGCTQSAEGGIRCEPGLYRDLDDDGTPDELDADRDGDGIIDVRDDDYDGDGIPNETDDDLDGDGVPNNEDADIDGDGIANEVDQNIMGLRRGKNALAQTSSSSGCAQAGADVSGLGALLAGVILWMRRARSPRLAG